MKFQNIRPLYTFTLIGLLSLTIAPCALAQPAEVAVRVEGVPFNNSDCLNGLDAIGFRPNFGGEAPFNIIVSAKSVNVQSGATVGFVIYSPDNSTFNDTVATAVMGSEWGSSLYWNLGSGNINPRFGSGLPDTLITGGAALPDAGFQSNDYIDILTITVMLSEDGIVCIDSAFVEPSGAWLMTPDGPPLWHGGGGDIADGGSRPDAFCVTVVPADPGEGPCSIPILSSFAQVRSGDTLALLDSAVATDLGLGDFSVTTNGAGIASVDSFGNLTYIPAESDVNTIVSVSLTFSKLTTVYPCPGQSKVFCTNSTNIQVLPANCCDTPGDADHSGATNIGDATFMISRIFAGGPAPICINEADADGDGAFNIGDASYLIARIFSGGPAPVCGSVVN